MKDDFEKEALRAYFKDTVEKFEQYFNDAEQFHKIFTELGFTYVDDGWTASVLNVSRCWNVRLIRG